MSTYRIWPATSGPGASQSFGGAIVIGTEFNVTSGGIWLDGYYYWIADASQSQSAGQQFALWQVSGTATGTHIAAGDVTAGALSIGWNFVSLTHPVPLSAGVTYKVQTGYSLNGVGTNNYWGTAGAGVNGLTNGPLVAYSDIAANGGTAADPYSNNQSSFVTGVSDPTANFGTTGFQSINTWLDLLLDNTAPANATYRLWPSYPVLPVVVNSQTTSYTLAIEFSLSQAATLSKIWFYSPSGAVALPGKCGVWDVGGQTVVSGSQNDAPSWSGAAGAGWVSCSYVGGPTLAASHNYKVAVFYSGGSQWFATQTSYWSSGAGASGITNGIITAPNQAGSSPGQGSYATASWAYPSTDGAGENYWVDIEVVPSTQVSIGWIRA